MKIMTTKNRENMKIKIGFIFIVFGLLGILAAVRIYKIASVNQRFEQSLKQYEYDTEEYISYYIYKNGYQFRYEPASFRDYSCFASVCTEEDTKMILESNGDLRVEGVQIHLFIWPLSRQYGLDFHFMEQGEEKQIQIYVDKNLNCLSEINSDETEEINSLIEDNRKKIEVLFEQAEQQWGEI